MPDLDTDTAQLTDKQLQKLHTRLWELVEMVSNAEPEDCSAREALRDADHRTLLAAASVVHRLMADLRYAHRAATTCYLTRPVVEPDSRRA